MKYFAYGSNMSLLRLRERAPGAKRLGMYCLKEHQLAFHKRSKDGSGKCDAYCTGDLEHRIYGALFEIDESEKRALDRAEGLGYGYAEKLVQVEDANGHLFEAITYCAIHIDKTLLPYSWYLNHVVVGAKELGVPNSYLENILNIKTIEDPDKERDGAQRGMYS